jgi:hypothetical protein
MKRLEAHTAKFLELARFSPKSLAFRSPDSFRTSALPSDRFPGEVSLFLGINKESLARDPICWKRLTASIRDWASTNCPENSLVIPDCVNDLFAERMSSECKPRARQVARQFKRTSLFRFFNATEGDFCHPVGKEFEGVFSKINKWPRQLGFLGLLPSQFRSLIKTKTGDPMAAQHISKTIFWAGYRVWKSRCEIVRNVIRVAPVFGGL